MRTDHDSFKRSACLEIHTDCLLGKNSREYLLRQVANGRYSLLLIVILTVVNLIMTILDTNTYFLFSASVPYYPWGWA